MRTCEICGNEANCWVLNRPFTWWACATCSNAEIKPERVKRNV